MAKRKHIPAKLRHEVFKRDNYRCRECGSTNKETTLEIDHIVPVSKGGTNDLSNLQTLCKKCNRAKHTRTWVGGVNSDENSNDYMHTNYGLWTIDGVSGSSVVEKTNKCPVCGTLINNHSNYCIKCGFNINSYLGSNYPNSKMEKKENTSTKTKSTKKLDKKQMMPIYLYIIVCIIVTAVLVVFVYSIFPTLGLLTFFLILICYLVGMREPIKKFVNSKLLQKK